VSRSTAVRIWLAVVLAASTTLRVSAQHYGYGVVSTIFGDQHAAKLAELGAGDVRLGFDWAVGEPAPGDYHFETFQRWADSAEALHLHIFASIGRPPAWAAPCDECLPYHLDDWYWYVRRLIEHFSYLGDAITFGVYNEPNLDVHLSVSGYAALVGYANAARLDANPRAKLGVPETEHGAVASGWFDAVMTSITPWLLPQDVVTVHWYPGLSSPPLDTYMQRVLDRVGNRETWLTETGKLAADDVLQWWGIRDVVTTFNERPVGWNWTKLFLYVLHTTDRDAPYSLTRADWSNRPAFDYYRDSMYTLLTVGLRTTDGRFVSAVNGGGGELAADRDAMGSWETFVMEDLDGGSLETGDLVRLHTLEGQFWRVNGGRLRANDPGLFRIDSVFVVTALDPGPIGAGGRFALSPYRVGGYVSASGGTLGVGAGGIGPGETFQLVVQGIR
jgi:Glycosyl hydrolase catalytic core